MSRRVSPMSASYAPPRGRRSAVHALVAAVVLGAVLAWGGQPILAADRSAAGGPLGLGADGRTFTDPDGAPFFWLADTAWSLFVDLNRSEVLTYLDARAGQGFTVIQTAALVAQPGGSGTNQYGDRPLIVDSPDVTEGAGGDEAGYDYWDHVDFVVEEAARRGLVVASRPLWMDDEWGGGRIDELLTADQAGAYGRFLGERYADAPVVWVLDASPAGGADVRQALADGIGRRLEVHLLDGRHGGRCPHPDLRRDLIDTAYGSGRPFVDGDSVHEGHPLCRDGALEGYATPLDVRRDAYTAVLGGAAGHTYGHRAVARFGAAPADGRGTWTLAMEAPGALQMRHVRALVESRPRLEPEANVLVGGGAGSIQAAMAADGSTVVAYTSTGREIDLDLDVLSGDIAQPWWYDPRTGEATMLAAVRSGGTVRFDPPGEGDWVLVVDDVDARRTAPGEPADRDGGDASSAPAPAPDDLSGAAGRDLDAPAPRPSTGVQRRRRTVSAFTPGYPCR